MRIMKSWQWLVIAALVLGGNAAWAQSDTLASVKQKGKLVVGVKADYKPFGYTDPSGKIVGLEVDLANDVGKRLGVPVELVPVIAANRMEFLKQGRIDLMIATMAYKPDRAEVVGIPEPFYYAGAASVFAKKNSGLKAWADLKGKPICGIQGAYYNRKTGEGFGTQLVVFKGVSEGDCARRRQLRRHCVQRRTSPASWARKARRVVNGVDRAWGMGCWTIPFAAQAT
jgi:polar amino acid transport system substrate-binding protein